MTTPQPAALPELSRGQIIDLISPLSNNSADHDIEFAHRVIAALQSQPAAAGVSDAEIDRIASENTYSVEHPTRFVTDARATVRAVLALRPQSYPLPDDLYDSKDWRQGNYASRVEWLHTMYEHAKQERDEYAAQLEALRPQAVPMTEDTARLDWLEANPACKIFNEDGEWSFDGKLCLDLRDAIDNARGITAQGAQGEQA